jgi:hypothetical protein
MNALFLTALTALLQETPAESGGGTGAIRIGAGVLALILVGIVIMRRKKQAKKEEDEF